jgi:hypothetical protein
MSSGHLDTTATIALFGAIAGIAGLAWVRLKPRQKIADDLPYGDWAHLPEALRAAKIMPGGGAVSAARAQTHTGTSLTHSGGAT